MRKTDGENTALRELFIASMGSDSRKALNELTKLGLAPDLIALILEEMVDKQLNQKSLINENKMTPKNKK